MIERRPWLVASVAAAIAYFFLRDAAMPEIGVLAVKGAACALLALYALLQGHGRDSRFLAAMMAVAALRDVAIGIDFGAGGLLFFLYPRSPSRSICAIRASRRGRARRPPPWRCCC